MGLAYACRQGKLYDDFCVHAGLLGRFFSICGCIIAACRQVLPLQESSANIKLLSIGSCWPQEQSAYDMHSLYTAVRFISIHVDAQPCRSGEEAMYQIAIAHVHARSTMV